eukprot:TRINITY_DN1357_c0_g1_i3.p1 TRINITY_DN1357_c0_g1~~TRINITY_DN1357_c0_g1_i3.p1  ORF type:complete len:702 (-),score=226.60 TRINITY_DN1357_c0_g1_i3:37-2013(-)
MIPMQELNKQLQHDDEDNIYTRDNMDDPNTTIALKYTDISYTVSKMGFSMTRLCFAPPQKKKILKDLNGAFYEGELSAIMGPSGAGKTTFLTLISGRYMTGKIEGEIRIHGTVRTWKNRNKFRRHCAFVAQDDTLFGNLTTMETFTFASRLRLPREMSSAKKHARVMEVVDELSLSRALPTSIGTPGIPGGVSGGERKRVSIGVEIIHDPNVIFMDEPTSGLDSWTARSVIQNLKIMTREKNKTIIVTIHQPSSEVFMLFDRLVVLARGEMIYNGKVAQVVPYFAGLGYQCPQFVNPSEFVMDLVQPGYGVDPLALREKKAENREAADPKNKDYVQTEDDINTTERIGKLVSSYAESPMAKEHTIRNKEHDTKPPQMDGNPNFWIVETLILLHRAALQTGRDKMKIYSKLMQVLFMGFFGGFIFLQLDNDQASIQSRQGVLFFCCTSCFMPYLMNVLTLFPMEKMVFFKEYSSGAYGSLSYYVAKNISELPFNIAFPMIFSIIIYFMVGLKTEADAFFIFYTCVMLVALNANSLGLLISTAISNLNLSLIMAPLIFLPMMIFGGLFANLDTVPSFISWMQYLSIIKYAYEIVATNEFEGETFVCDAGDAICIQTGEQALARVAMDDIDIGLNFGILCSFLVCTTVAAYIFLAFSLRNY